MDRHPNHFRFVFVCAALLGALLIFTAPALAEDTAVVHGVISDNAVVMKPVVNATVTIAGMSALVTDQGYTVSGVPAGPQTMVVTAPRHLPLTQVITVLPIDQAIDVALSLTARETYLRYCDAYNHKRFALAWKMVHPDVKAHLVEYGHRVTFKTYCRDFVWWNVPFVSVRIKAIRSDAKWVPEKRAHLPHAAYYGITHVTRTIRYTYAPWEARSLGMPLDRVYSNTCWIHWQNVAGRWYTIFDSLWNDK